MFPAADDVTPSPFLPLEKELLLPPSVTKRTAAVTVCCISVFGFVLRLDERRIRGDMRGRG